MESKKILRILNKSLIIAVAISILSFIFPIIPCKTAAVVATPTYAWSMCKLPNPFKESLVGLSTKFWASSTEPLTGLIIQFLVSFIIFTIVFMLIRKKAAKILDLTHKK
jgi:hypothetical protein